MYLLFLCCNFFVCKQINFGLLLFLMHYTLNTEFIFAEMKTTPKLVVFFLCFEADNTKSDKQMTLCLVDRYFHV